VALFTDVKIVFVSANSIPLYSVPHANTFDNSNCFKDIGLSTFKLQTGSDDVSKSPLVGVIDSN